MAKTGQSTIQFAALMAIVVAGLLAMQIYAKRAFSGKLRAAADSIGEQYAPGQTTSTITLTTTSDTTTTSVPGTVTLTAAGGQPSATADVLITQTVTAQDSVTKTGSQTVGPLGTDLWSESTPSGG